MHNTEESRCTSATRFSSRIRQLKGPNVLYIRGSLFVLRTADHYKPGGNGFLDSGVHGGECIDVVVVEVLLLCSLLMMPNPKSMVGGECVVVAVEFDAFRIAEVPTCARVPDSEAV